MPAARFPGEHLYRQIKHRSRQSWVLLLWCSFSVGFIWHLLDKMYVQRQAPHWSLKIAAIATFLLTYRYFVSTRRSVRRLKKGLEGEAQVYQTLLPLQDEGWKFELNLQMREVGDIDVFATSPHNNHFVIDAKNIAGDKVIDVEGIVLRRSGKSSVDKVPHGDRLLKKVKRQALVLKKHRHLPWVHALICFTQPTLTILSSQQPVNGVYVTELTNLVTWLRQLDQEQTPQ